MAKALSVFGIFIGAFLLIAAVLLLTEIGLASPKRGSEDWSWLVVSALSLIFTVVSVVFSLLVGVSVLVYLRTTELNDPIALYLFGIAIFLNVAATGCWALQAWKSFSAW